MGLLALLADMLLTTCGRSVKMTLIAFKEKCYAKYSYKDISCMLAIEILLN